MSSTSSNSIPALAVENFYLISASKFRILRESGLYTRPACLKLRNTMDKVKIIYLTGRTGKKYRFYTFPGPENLKAEGGVFAITKRRQLENKWEHEVCVLMKQTICLN
jgi:hypothetical protein